MANVKVSDIQTKFEGFSRDSANNKVIIQSIYSVNANNNYILQPGYSFDANNNIINNSNTIIVTANNLRKFPIFLFSDYFQNATAGYTYDLISTNIGSALRLSTLSSGLSPQQKYSITFVDQNTNRYSSFLTVYPFINTKYDVSYNGSTIQSNTGNNITITNLSENSTYMIDIIPRNNIKIFYALKYRVEVVTLVTPPIIYITKQGGTGLTLNVNGFQTFLDISYNNSNLSTDIITPTTIPSSLYSLSVINLQNGTMCRIQVIPKNKIGRNDLSLSTIVSFVLLNAIGRVTYTTLTSTSLNLNWTTASGTTVDISYNDVIQYSNLSVITLAISGLIPNTIYTFVIYSRLPFLIETNTPSTLSVATLTTFVANTITISNLANYMNGNQVVNTFKLTWLPIIGGDWIDIILPTSITITSYSITNNAITGSPTSWTLFGSTTVNGLTWVQIDSRFNITWNNSPITQTYTTSAATYIRYRLVFNNIIPTNYSTSSVFSTGTRYSSGSYDGITGNYIGSFSTNVNINGTINKYYGDYFQIQLPGPVVINNYRIISMYDQSDIYYKYYLRTPYTWMLVGSNDANIWFLVDSETNIAFNSPGQEMYFLTTSTSDYIYYRLIVQSIQPFNNIGYAAFANCVLNENTNLLISEFRIIASTSAYPPAALTGYSTNITGTAYGTGIYRVSSSFNYNTFPWYVFDNNNGTAWYSCNYNAYTGVYLGSGYDISYNGSIKQYSICNLSTTVTTQDFASNFSNIIHIYPQNIFKLNNTTTFPSTTLVTLATLRAYYYTALAPTSLTLNWTAATPTAATSYDISYNGLVRVNTTVTSTSITGLIANTQYTFWIIPKNSGAIASNDPSIYTSISIYTGSSITGTPTITNLGTNSLTLNWTYATTYNSVDISWNGAIRLRDAYGTSCAIYNLIENTSYTFWLYTRNQSNVVSTTNIATAAIVTFASLANRGVIITAITPTTMLLSWYGNTQTAVDISYNGSIKNSAVTGTSTSITLSGLTANTYYTFEVQPRNSSGLKIPNTDYYIRGDALTLALLQNTVTSTTINSSIVNINWTTTGGNWVSVDISYNGNIQFTNITSSPINIALSGEWGGQALKASTAYAYHIYPKNWSGQLTTTSTTYYVSGSFTTPATITYTWGGVIALDPTSNVSLGYGGVRISNIIPAATTTSFTLSWGSGTQNTVDISYNGAVRNSSVAGTSTTITYTNSTLITNTYYDIWIIPLASASVTNTNGIQGSSFCTFAIIPTTPAATAQLYASYIILSWPAGNYSNVDISFNGFIQYSNIGGTSCTIDTTGLMSNVAYPFWIYPKNQAGINNTVTYLTVNVTLTTLANPEFIASNTLSLMDTAVATTGTGASNTSIRINWNPGTAYYYDISYNGAIQITGVQRNCVFKLKEVSTGKFLNINRNENNCILDTVGMNLSFFYDWWLYGYDKGTIGLYDISGGGFLRHSGYVLHSNWFEGGNSDFAWHMLPTGTLNNYTIFNYYGENTNPFYLDFSTDTSVTPNVQYVRIAATRSPKTWQLVVVTPNSYEIPNLLENTTYPCNIYPTNFSQIRNLASTQTVTATTFATLGSSSLTFTNLTSTTVSVFWSMNNQTNVDISFNGAIRNVSVTGNTASLALTGLIAGTQYPVWVIPKNVAGNNNLMTYASGTLTTLSTFYANTFGQYPPTTLAIGTRSGTGTAVDPYVNTTSISGQTYGNGTYVAYASSINSTSYYGLYAFDGTASSWVTANNTYNASTGVYTGTNGLATDQGTFMGEWVHISLPEQLIIRSYSITTTNIGTSNPSLWIFAGSNDGYNWNVVDNQTNTNLFPSINVMTTKTFYLIDNNNGYSFYRYLVRSATPAYAYVGIYDIKFNTNFTDTSPSLLKQSSITLCYAQGLYSAVDISYNGSTQVTNYTSSNNRYIQSLLNFAYNTTYTFTIYPRNSDGIANTTGASITCVTLAAIRAIYISNQTPISLTLNWISSNVVATSVDISYNNATQIVAATGTSRVITGLIYGVNYIFTVIPVNSVGLRNYEGAISMTVTWDITICPLDYLSANSSISSSLSVNNNFYSAIPACYYSASDTSGISSTVQGIFATRRLFSLYSGPIIQLRRNSDNNIQDFYANKYGILNTSIDGTGTPYITWVGVAIAFVSIWYDQSGRGNNFIQPTTTLQPTYNYTNFFIDFNSPTTAFMYNSTLNPTSGYHGIMPTGDTGYTALARINTAPTGSLRVIFGSGKSGSNTGCDFGIDSANARLWTSWGGTTDVYSAVSSVTAGARVTYMYTPSGGLTVNKAFFVNSTLSISSAGALTNVARGSTTTNDSSLNYIGRGVATNSANYMGTQLYYFMLFSNALYDIDRLIADNITQLPYYSPYQPPYPILSLDAGTAGVATGITTTSWNILTTTAAAAPTLTYLNTNGLPYFTFNSTKYFPGTGVGTNQTINSSLNFNMASNGGFTSVCLVNFTTFPTSGTCNIYKLGGGNGTYLQEFFIYPSGGISPRFFNLSMNASSTLLINRWYLIIFNVSTNGSSSSYNLYVNNVVSNSGSGSGLQNNSYNLININSDIGASGVFKLAHLSLYDRSLSTLEMAQIYNSVFNIIGTNI